MTNGDIMSTKTQNTIPHWDVSNVYPDLDSPEFQADTSLLDQSLTALETYLEQNQIQKKSDGAVQGDPQKIADILDHLVGQMNGILELIATLRAYINAFTATDSYNVAAKKAFSNWEQSYVRSQQSTNRIRGWIGSLGKLLEESLEYGTVSQEHAFTLREIADQSQ